MITAWTAHIKDEAEKNTYAKNVMSAKWVLDRQIQIMDGIKEGLENKEISPLVYDKPNWDYRNAHANGYKQALRDIRYLIDLDPKEKVNDR